MNGSSIQMDFWRRWTDWKTSSPYIRYQPFIGFSGSLPLGAIRSLSAVQALFRKQASQDSSGLSSPLSPDFKKPFDKSIPFISSRSDKSIRCFQQTFDKPPSMVRLRCNTTTGGTWQHRLISLYFHQSKGDSRAETGLKGNSGNCSSYQSLPDPLLFSSPCFCLVWNLQDVFTTLNQRRPIEPYHTPRPRPPALVRTGGLLQENHPGSYPCHSWNSRNAQQTIVDEIQGLEVCSSRGHYTSNRSMVGKVKWKSVLTAAT